MAEVHPIGAPPQPKLDRSSAEWPMHLTVEEINEADKETPDNWVPRHVDLVRHTGKHPFNAEPPLEKLGADFITPVALHYVRTHGAVPKLDWQTHRLEINGMVERPCLLTMDHIIKMPSVTIPVTLTCSGLRRREMNAYRKSIGFSWGPGATSTSYWTGVLLSELLRKVGAKSPAEGAHYVCFKGPKGELPKGEDGSYGTSIDIGHAMYAPNEVIIAYKQNGRFLTPDHGYPLRLIIPGYIAGRMVKWLSEITVTKNESDNFYHYHDNRLLPSHVDERTMQEGWLTDPDYTIDELNINSVIVRPAHDEVVSLKSAKAYKIQGFAYSGGGRKIIRVEVSIDDGKTWLFATINRFEKPNAFKKVWCWVFWELEVQPLELVFCSGMLVRAFDQTQNTQPSEFGWNVLGMSLNNYHKLKAHKHITGSEFGLRFQHPAPCQPGPLGNIGWMEEEGKGAQISPAPPPQIKLAEEKEIKTYTMEEVAQHNDASSCWFVHEGRVYDATTYLSEHPGGGDSILSSAGQDATVEFNSIHSEAAFHKLYEYYIGDLKAAPLEKQKTIEMIAEEVFEEAPISLNPKKKLAFPLKEVIPVSHNVKIFRFSLPSEKHVLGLPCGYHIFVYAKIKGVPVMRAYTPITGDETPGYVDFLIKIYWANEHPRFPEGGQMSQHFAGLSIGDTLDFKGPVGHFNYMGGGKYFMNKKTSRVNQFTMVAGGTGITPMYTVMKKILSDPSDKTEIALLFANRTEEDILLREELDSLAQKHDNFKVWYTIDSKSAPENWKYSTGYVDQEMLEHSTFPPTDLGLVLLCGPKGLCESACKPALQNLGWDMKQIIEF